MVDVLSIQENNEYGNFKSLKLPLKGDKGTKEKNRRYEIIWVIIHIYTEMLH
jgi:hypothetical protein